MNNSLSTAEADALLEILYRGLLQIRLAGMAGDAARAEAIADALHNVPYLIAKGDNWGWSIANFCELFLDGLIAKYPDLAGLTQPLDDLTA